MSPATSSSWPPTGVQVPGLTARTTSRSRSSTSDAAEGERVFNALAEGGTIEMPFADQFWGGKFGSLTDRFGVQWMISAR